MLIIRAVLIFTLSAAASAADALQPPAGFMQPARLAAETPSATTCPAIPEPFTGTLDFTSKYAGSDSARATLNPQAEQAFHQQTARITRMERLVSQQVTAWSRSGNPQHIDCVVDALNRWASADALTGSATNHTGRSMRKWALASFSSAWLQLAFSPDRPLAAHVSQQQTIEHWFGKLGEMVASDWRDLPLKKVNNHSYWAAWALISTAVVTQREDLYAQSLAIYHTAMQQVDNDGYLPGELRRRQRAFAYHNYAIQPLVAIALFARANGEDIRRENHDALQRLGERIIRSLNDASDFKQQTTVDQDLAFLHQPSNLAWLEGWCQLYSCDHALTQRIARLRPLQNTRLGGDLTHLY